MNDLTETDELVEKDLSLEVGKMRGIEDEDKRNLAAEFEERKRKKKLNETSESTQTDDNNLPYEYPVMSKEGIKLVNTDSKKFKINENLGKQIRKYYSWLLERHDDEPED